MSRIANSIKHLRETLVATADALKVVNDVLDETEPFYFELFRQRMKLGEELDQQYVESLGIEHELKKLCRNENSFEADLHNVQQIMTDVINKIYLEKPDSS